MEIKFQYNKISQQKLQNDIGIRQKALPILRARESALRLEVKTQRKRLEELKNQTALHQRVMEKSIFLWSEFPELVKVVGVKTKLDNLAGIKTTTCIDVEFETAWFSVFQQPKWFLEGVSMLKKAALLRIKQRFEEEKLELLVKASKKTTQKVNLYEKVQIPAYEKALYQIKRFLEDEETLARASQKILKKGAHI